LAFFYVTFQVPMARGTGAVRQLVEGELAPLMIAVTTGTTGERGGINVLVMIVSRLVRPLHLRIGRMADLALAVRRRRMLHQPVGLAHRREGHMAGLAIVLEARMARDDGTARIARVRIRGDEAPCDPETAAEEGNDGQDQLDAFDAIGLLEIVERDAS